MKVQCATCPFREGGWTELREFLSIRALTQASPICHSSGRGALSKKKVSQKSLLCRGARLLQAQYFHRIGFLSEPTIEAWEAKVAEVAATARSTRPRQSCRAQPENRSTAAASCSTPSPAPR
jgi:hypothetical protein